MAEAQLSWHHTGLTVRDLDAAVRFYRDALGGEVLFISKDITDEARSIVGLPMVSADVAQLAVPGSQEILELVHWRNVPDERRPPTSPGEAHVAVRANDFDASLNRFMRLGAKALGEVTMFPDGRAAYLHEPSGTVLELEEEPSE